MNIEVCQTINTSYNSPLKLLINKKGGQIMSKYLMATVAAIIIMNNPSWADEQVKIESDEQLNQLPKKWECKWKDQFYSGTSVVDWDDVITLKKISGTSQNEHCGAISDNINAKIKKGEFTYKTKNKSPCGSVIGTDTLYKSADGAYYIKGKYQYTTNGLVVRGTQECRPR